MGQLSLSPSQMEHYVLSYGSECFVHVPNQSALTDGFQDTSKMDFNLHPWAVTGTVGVSQFRQADGVGLHQFRAPVQGAPVQGAPVQGLTPEQLLAKKRLVLLSLDLRDDRASFSVLENLLLVSASKALLTNTLSSSFSSALRRRNCCTFPALAEGSKHRLLNSSMS